MGPFVRSALVITDSKKEKVWVGTRRAGVHTRAKVTVVGPDGTTRHYSRAPASAAGFRSFYPGLVAVTEPGTWIMSAQVGPDHMCVYARYQ